MPSDFSEFRIKLESPVEHGTTSIVAVFIRSLTAHMSLRLIRLEQKKQREPVELFPELGQPQSQKGLYCLASALMSTGADLNQALLICGLCSSDSSSHPGLSNWEDIPTELRD